MADDPTPQINPWRACFNDPLVERQYREHRLAGQVRQAMAMVAVVVAVPTIQIFGELPRFLAGEQALAGLLLTRLASFAAALAMFLFLRKTTSQRLMERVTTLYVLFLITVSCVVYGYYPAASAMAPAAVVATTVMIYFFAPLPLINIGLLGLIMSVVGGIEIIIQRNMSTPDLFRVTLWLLAINLMGYFGVRAYNRTMRELFWDQRLLAAAYQREQAAFRSFKQFAELIGHEFRNPLAVVKSKAQLLRLIDETGAPADQDALPAIERAVDRLDRLFSEWLDRDRLAEGDLTLASRTLSLSTILGRVRAIAPHSRLHPIRFTLRGSDAQISADPALLETVISNLLDNAVKYSPSGGEIAVSSWRDGSHAVIAVEDQGVGIPPEQIEHVFEKYFRVSHDGAVRGFGLGLFLVRRIVEIHGGSVEVESQPGRGTTVFVRLPLIHDA